MTRPALIGDIGGTNARFALVTPDAFDLQAIQTLRCADYPTLEAAVRDYLARVGAVGERAPREACLAFACPVHDDDVRLTNNAWRFSKRRVKADLALELFKVINDFTAQALGIPHVDAEQLVAVGAGQADAHRTRLVIGPGTGLGMAGLFPGQHDWIPLPTEGGHVTFAPTDEFEQQLVSFLRGSYGRVSVERVLCGQGLLELYRAHAHDAGIEARHDSPAAVTDGARDGDPVAEATILRFLKMLGDVCGDAALTFGARGGVYLCGGVVPRLLDWLPRSDFRRAFADKGRMSDFNASLPVWVVTAPWTGLLGACEALHNQEVA